MTDFSPLSIDQVVYIHERIIAQANGVQGVRDFALLHSGLERCKATFGGQDLYPELFEKVAALWHSMTMNHPFLDGNKRTAYEVMKRFLYFNGYCIVAPPDEIIRMCISVDNDHLDLRQIVAWLEKHTQIMA